MKKLFTIAILTISLGLSATASTPRIFVKSQGQVIELNKEQLCKLRSFNIKGLAITLESFKFGGTIQNNDTADLIFKLLK